MSNKIFRTAVVFVVAWIAGPVSDSAQATEWGSVQGRILVDGAIAKPPTYSTRAGGPLPPNETIVIGKHNGLANACVYLRVPTGQKIDISPEYAAAFKKPVVLEIKGRAFRPHVTLVRVGQTLNIKNSDPFGYNINLSFLSFNQVIPVGGLVPVKVVTGTPLPSNAADNIHPFMKGWILALDHPYMAVTDEEGTFEIKNVPVGEHSFQFWHEATGYVKNVAFNGGITNTRGLAKLPVTAGQTLDLGDMVLEAKILRW